MSDFSTAKSWDAVADNYAEWTAKHLQPYSEKVLAMAGLKPNDRVVDVACGPGTLSVLAAAQVAHVEGIDFAPKMVEHCLARAPANLRVQVGDGHALAFADDAFDAAFSMFGLAFFDDRVKALGELHRVLKPGGRAWVSTWVPFTESPALSKLGPVIGILHPEITPPAGVQMNNPGVIREEFAAAGFRDVEVHPLDGTLRIDDVDEMWERLVEGNVFVRYLRDQIGDELFDARAPAAKAAFAEGLEPGMELSQPALLGVGRK